MRPFLAALAALAISSCGERPARSAGSDSAAGSSVAGMKMEMPSIKLMFAMRAHLDSMRTSPAERMKAMMGTHQEMASSMMDAMGADMRTMSMSGDSAWTGLNDSVRRDLGDLPGLSGEALTSRMRAHADRMERLLDQHEGMMGSMK